MIYEPREDSYLLQKYVKTYASGKVLDVGSGSGVQALTAKEKTEDVLAVDIDPDVVEHLKELGLNAKVSDLFSTVEGKFDLIIFNPPYLPEDDGEDEESRKITTAGKEGYEIIGRFLKDAKKHLNDGGKILIITSSLSGDSEKLFEKYGFKFALLEKEHYFFEDIKVYCLESLN